MNKSVYLVVKRKFRPAPSTKTHIKDWHTDPNKWKVDEDVLIVDGRVKLNDMTSASVIIDLLSKRVLKSRGGEPDTDLISYYYSMHRDDIMQGLLKWATKSPENLERYSNLVNEPAGDKTAD